jgi:hypothetical protein
MKKLSIKTIFESVLNEERGDNYFKALMTTKPEVLANLAQDKDVDVRLAVLKNSGVTPLILQTMSRDENYTVRSIVAQNRATPSEVLAELSKDKEFVVRYYVASNPNTPKEILNQLTNDKNKDVAVAAKNASVSFKE